MKPDWWLPEAAFAGEEHLDETYVAAYDAKAQVDPTEDVETLVSHGLGDQSLLLDLGAGTGVFTLAAAGTGASVISIDVSPAMTSVIARRAADFGYDNIRVVEAGFLSYEHEERPVDFVYTRNALHQLPDFWKVVALQSVADVMKSDAILLARDLVFDLDPGSVEAGIDEWMSGAVDDPTEGFTAQDLADHVRKEFSTYTWLFEPMLERCGFEILDASSRRSAYGRYLCRKL